MEAEEKGEFKGKAEKGKDGKKDRIIVGIGPDAGNECREAGFKITPVCILKIVECIVVGFPIGAGFPS